MSYENQIYHRHRAEQCRSMAGLAADPIVRRRHEELARLHASRALSLSEILEVEAV